MVTLDLTGDRTDLVFAQDNDKILSVGPFTQSGAIVSSASKRLRIVIKPSEDTADASATLDKDSVTNTTIVYTVGAEEDGTWEIDLRNLLPAVGQYWYRIDLTASSALTTDREIVAKGTLTVKSV